MVKFRLTLVLRSISIFVKNMIYNQIGWVHVSKIISAVYASEALNKDLETGLEVGFQLNSATKSQEKSV